VKLNRSIVSHGFALNLTTDIGYFDGIIPCGHVERRPTSVEAIIKEKVETKAAAIAYAEKFARVFDTSLVWDSAVKVLSTPAR
jgi:lipoyl(octanoyl) transferase